MTLTEKDVADVGKLVKQKLELYMNREKREVRFDPAGYCRTTRKMFKYDFIYRVINYDVLDKRSPRFKNKKKKTGASDVDLEMEKYDKKEKKNLAKTNRTHNADGDVQKGKDGEKEEEEQSLPINPKLQDTTRRMILYREADRLTQYANEVYLQTPVKELQQIHHHRPSSVKVPLSPERGKIQNYNRHVGAILHTKNYVDFYKKEGLHIGGPKDAKTSRSAAEGEEEEKKAKS